MVLTIEIKLTSCALAALACLPRQPEALRLALNDVSDFQLSRLHLIGRRLKHLELAAPLATSLAWAPGLHNLTCLSLAGCTQLPASSLWALPALPHVSAARLGNCMHAYKALARAQAWLMFTSGECE